MYKKQLTEEQAFQKLKHYCAYQERCRSEVTEKLYDLGITKKEHDSIIISLVESNCLDEERFAIAYAIGKFRIKQWGRIKIKYELSKKRISNDLIGLALQRINEKIYRDVLQKLAKEKYAALKNEQWLIRKKRTIDFLMQKGYEGELVNKVVNGLQGRDKNNS